MANCKIGLTIILVFFGFISFGQGNPLIYGGAEYFRNTGYVSNAYFNVNIGLQLFRWQFLAPEIGYEYTFGNLRDNNELHPDDPNARALSKVKDELGMLNRSRMNTTYRMVSNRFKGEIPTTCYPA